MNKYYLIKESDKFHKGNVINDDFTRIDGIFEGGVELTKEELVSMLPFSEITGMDYQQLTINVKNIVRKIRKVL